MDDSDSSSSRPRRRIPSVTDLVDELSRRLRVTPPDQPLLFQAAQQVCAEELKMVRTGFLPGTMEDLVERARKLLPASLLATDTRSEAWSETAPFGDSGARPQAPSRPDTGGPFDWGTEQEASADGPQPAISIYPEEPRPKQRPVEPMALPSDVAAPARHSRVAPARRKPEPVIFKSAHEQRPSRFGTALVILLSALALAVGLCFVPLPRVGRIADRFESPEESTRLKAILAPIFRAIRPKAKSEPASPSRTEIFPPQTSTASPSKTAPATSAGTTSGPPPAAGTTTPAPKRNRPASVPAPPPAPSPSSSPTLPASPPGSMISPEWAGKASAYVLHFTSFQKEENARRDAERISRLVGRKAMVLSVNLGKEGLWYRVVVGPFPTKDAALAYRGELAGKGTPDLGLVYRALSPK